MTEPIVMRRPFLIALVTLLQVTLPPLVAVATLTGTMALYDVPFDRKY